MRDGHAPAVLGGRPLFEEPIPIARPVVPEAKTLESDISFILASGQLTKGRYLAEFERTMAEHLGVRHVVAVSSCTAGLMLAYEALGLKGDVLMPSFTFMATPHALKWSGGVPVFVDVDPNTWNIDVQAVEASITPNTCGIVAVHVFGNPAPVEALERIAREHKVRLVFDAAHAFGSLHNGRPLGRFGDVEVFSTTPTKLLCTGEGGVVATNNDEIAEQIRVAREYGNTGGYDCREPGLNARMPELAALLGTRGLPLLEPHVERRNEIAGLYRERLSRIPGLSFQAIASGDRSSYKDFSMTVDEDRFGLGRDRLVECLRAEGIDTRNYYDPPMHRLQAYGRLSGDSQQTALPVTDALASSSTSLPVYYTMTDETVERVCLAIERLHVHAEAVQHAAVLELQAVDA